MQTQTILIILAILVALFTVGGTLQSCWGNNKPEAPILPVTCTELGTTGSTEKKYPITNSDVDWSFSMTYDKVGLQKLRPAYLSGHHPAGICSEHTDYAWHSDIVSDNLTLVDVEMDDSKLLQIGIAI
jgi:hypothetical protein